MPLVFQSLSHGEVAFGFFNIDTDMLLLQRCFFFANDFCRNVALLASCGSGRLEGGCDSYVLEESDVGNLMGAIQGVEFRGFIGATYRLFPFPTEPWAFKQNPEGHRTRDAIEGIIRKYGKLSRILIEGEASGAWIAIGDYVFDRRGFHELLQYVWMGGYPRWKDGIRPQYVLDMKRAVEESTHPLFGLRIDA